MLLDHVHTYALPLALSFFSEAAVLQQYEIVSESKYTLRTYHSFFPCQGQGSRMTQEDATRGTTLLQGTPQSDNPMQVPGKEDSARHSEHTQTTAAAASSHWTPTDALMLTAHTANITRTQATEAQTPDPPLPSRATYFPISSSPSASFGEPCRLLLLLWTSGGDGLRPTRLGPCNGGPAGGWVSGSVGGQAAICRPPPP